MREKLPYSHTTAPDGLGCYSGIDEFQGIPATVTTVTIVVVIIVLIRSFTNLVTVIRD